jgi:hypothetical protein
MCSTQRSRQTSMDRRRHHRARPHRADADYSHLTWYTQPRPTAHSRPSEKEPKIVSPNKATSASRRDWRIKLYCMDHLRLEL